MTETRSLRRCLLAWAIAFALVPMCADAQDRQTPVVWDVTRDVLLDPTTYTPAALGYTAQLLDWKSSQVFFEHGWLEQNRRFTVSGRPNDVAVDYREGVRLIRAQALSTLQASAVNNLAAGVAERLLAARYPTRRKLWRAIGWTERIAFASYLAYVASAEHWRQIRRNGRLEEQYGY